MQKIIFANHREFTLGGKYGDQICGIPSPNVSYGLWNSWFGRNAKLFQQARLRSARHVFVPRFVLSLLRISTYDYVQSGKVN
jgi:hypothetical protein